MKQAVDIEQLLRWAYRDELAKRVTSSAEGLWAQLADWRDLGASIDLGTSSPQRYDLGLPHEDALAIERAVGALPNVVLDWQREAPSVLGDLLGLMDPAATFLRSERTPVRLVGHRNVVGWTSRRGTKVRVEVEPVRDVILVNTLRPSALVTMHASMGTRPDWIREQPRPEPVPAERGHGPKVVGECRGRNWYTSGSHCPLRWDPSPTSIAQARGDYLVWWRALDQLARELRLEKFLALAPGCAEMPWLAPPRAHHVVGDRFVMRGSVT